MNLFIYPVLLLAISLFALAFKTAGRLSVRNRRWFELICFVCGVPGLLYSFYYLHILPEPVWFYSLRTLPVSELFASGLGVTVGAFAAARPKLKWQGLLLMCLFLFVPFAKPLLRPLDYNKLKNRVIDDVCLQSSLSTCGPASTVSLLNLFDVQSTEAELARECYTCSSGTELWYLARALKKREVDVRFQHSSKVLYPSIAGVKIMGAGHFIAVLGRSPDGGFIIAEPLRGKLVYTAEELRKHYLWTGFYMVVSQEV